MLSQRKREVNARIVIVGASTTGLAFLQHVLSMPHLQFNSLTLVAPGGWDAQAQTGGSMGDAASASSNASLTGTEASNDHTFGEICEVNHVLLARLKLTLITS